MYCFAPKQKLGKGEVSCIFFMQDTVGSQSLVREAHKLKFDVKANFSREHRT